MDGNSRRRKWREKVDWKSEQEEWMGNNDGEDGRESEREEWREEKDGEDGRERLTGRVDGE